MENETKIVIYWWFILVSFMNLVIMFLVQKEPPFIILNIFIAPVSIIIYFVFISLKD